MRFRTAAATGLITAALTAGFVSPALAAPGPRSGGPKGCAKSTCTSANTTTTAPSTTSTSTTSTTSTTSVPSTTTTVASASADTAAPSVAITSPANGATVTGAIAVTGGSADNSQVARVDVAVDDAPWSPASGTSNWSSTIDTRAFADGPHMLRAQATDTAGNIATTSLTVDVSNAAPDSARSTSTAPDAQGSWRSPEGLTINVSTAGPWTIRNVYAMVLDSAAAAGDFDRIAPTLTVEVQDTTSSFTQSAAWKSEGHYTSFSSTIYLQGVNSTFALKPNDVTAHEYGHTWTLYHLYMTKHGDWSSYLNHRWTAGDGSAVLAGDSRLDTSHSWKKNEIIADDFRLLLGSAAAIEERPSHLNSSIPHPSAVSNLRSFLLATWATA
jgi:hypothetical protein